MDALQQIIAHARSAGRGLVDFALPPRCAGCGDITEEVGTFCAPCWGEVEWLTDACCTGCGLPLEGTDERICAACLAKPPSPSRVRAATVYDEVSRDLVLRFKHGRRVALARTMGAAMARYCGDLDGALLIPVPLHRGRLWKRGFNQSLLLANEISSRVGGDVLPDTLRRRKATKTLGGLNARQRAAMVRAAFALHDQDAVRGRRVVLVDDVYTTGATLRACSKVLEKAGAASVEAIVWARVARPHHLKH